MSQIKEPEMLVSASIVIHLVECFRQAHLVCPEGEYGTTSEMYNDLRDKAERKMAEFNRKIWEN